MHRQAGTVRLSRILTEACHSTSKHRARAPPLASIGHWCANNLSHVSSPAPHPRLKTMEPRLLMNRAVADDGGPVTRCPSFYDLFLEGAPNAPRGTALWMFVKWAGMKCGGGEGKKKKWRRRLSFILTSRQMRLPLQFHLPLSIFPEG